MAIFNGQVVNGAPTDNIYSTEETRIGTWIDRKPLYRKTLFVKDATFASDEVAPRFILVSPDNFTIFDTIVDVRCNVYYGSVTVVLPYQWVSVINTTPQIVYRWMFEIGQRSGIYVSYIDPNKGGATVDIAMTLQYTKVADTTE